MSRAPIALAALALACPGLAAQEPRPAPPVARPLPAPVPPAVKPQPAPVPARPAAPPAVVRQQFVLPLAANDGGDQFTPHFRQLFRSELRLLRAAAEPSRPQYDALLAEEEAVATAAAKVYGRSAQNGLAGDVDPRRALGEAFTAAAQKHLAPEQAARYKTEVDLRAAARKRMIVANLVVMVDAAVVLSADQRKQLADVLANNWNAAWNQTMYFSMGGRYFPPMPDAKVRVLLTDPQRVVWDGIPKGNVRFGANLNVPAWADVGDDEPWPDAPPAKPAAKKPTKTEGTP